MSALRGNDENNYRLKQATVENPNYAVRPSISLTFSWKCPYPHGIMYGQIIYKQNYTK